VATKNEWFRRTSWTTADHAEFMARLTRSRTSFHKAQYLRIQALHLAQNANPPLYAEALELLDLLVREYPDPSQVGAAHQQRAQCLAALDRGSDALDEFRRAIGAERAHRGIQGYVYLEFAELVLALGRKDLSREALSFITDRESTDLFPIAQYRKAAAAAFLCEELGLNSEAHAYAVDALAAAAKTESPFRYHRRLGVVTVTDSEVQARLWRLAGIA
jgi:tetratricopeptide (TPR) repeat protein